MYPDKNLRYECLDFTDLNEKDLDMTIISHIITKLNIDHENNLSGIQFPSLKWSNKPSANFKVENWSEIINEEKLLTIFHEICEDLLKEIEPNFQEKNKAFYDL